MWGRDAQDGELFRGTGVVAVPLEDIGRLGDCGEEGQYLASF